MNIFIGMMNSPKTSVSFSELQTAYDLLMPSKRNRKASPSSSVAQQSETYIKINKSMNSPLGTSLQQQHVNSSELSIQVEQGNDLGLNSKIKQYNQPLVQTSANVPYSTLPSIKGKPGQQRQIVAQKSENSERSIKTNKTNNGIGKLKSETYTQNSQSNSFSLGVRNPNHTSSSNQLRKSVQNEAFLHSLDSMFRKKISPASANQQTQTVNNKGQLRKSKKNSSHRKNHESMEMYQLSQRLKQAVVLSERLKNIRIFYEMKVHAERQMRRTNDRVFMDLIHENEKIHRQKIRRIQGLIQEQNRQKLSITRRQRVITRIESATQLSIMQRDKAYDEYSSIQEEILRKRERIMEKEKYLQRLRKQKKEYRDEVEENQKGRQRLNKWYMEMEGLVVRGDNKIQNLKKVLQRDYEGYY